MTPEEKHRRGVAAYEGSLPAFYRAEYGPGLDRGRPHVLVHPSKTEIDTFVWVLWDGVPDHDDFTASIVDGGAFPRGITATRAAIRANLKLLALVRAKERERGRRLPSEGEVAEK